MWILKSTGHMARFVEIFGGEDELARVLNDAGSDGFKSALPSLIVVARQIVAAGVSVSPVEYLELTGAERVALARAQKEERIAQAIRIGNACRGEIGQAAVLSEVDGGEAHDDMILEAFHNSVYDIFSLGEAS